MDESTEIAAIRVRLRSTRAGLGVDEQQRRSRGIVDVVGRLPWWGRVRHLATYHAVGGELDLDALATAARARGAITYLPVLDGDSLRFAPTDDDTATTPNRFGIPEPTSPTVDARSLDVVLVPAVGIDRSGNRVGMGGGYYDRTFSWLADEVRPTRPLLVAAVHDEQVLDHVAPRPWDVTVDMVVTPTTTYLVDDRR